MSDRKPLLYLMRHGQTEFNAAHVVQGQCDSPLTPLGIEQAHEQGRWIASQGISFSRICSSPLGRTRQTVGVVREELVAAAGGSHVPEVEIVPALIERSYGVFEKRPAADLPGDLWSPGEQLVQYGGEGDVAVRSRMVPALVEVMRHADGGDVLAVSHGSASRVFKNTWAASARCDQDVVIGNCCVMVYEFDPVEGTFSNILIHNLPQA